ncbi:MAG TPA: FlgD immunoglobulin-like domain containing protein [bacterium]|nr:FlgD immunoglobulin-like domain containing protein [bacterium]
MKSFFFWLIQVAILPLAQAQNNLDLLAVLNGERNSNEFGVVAGVGDVNADGFGDFVAGAPGGNYAKLYFGGALFDSTRFLRLNPPACATFGYAIAGGSDLNGDGYSDFIIGAPYSSVGPPDYFTSCGKVFVYFGGAHISGNADLLLTGQGWYYMFGEALAMAGDVNNDGYDDIIIGAPNDDWDGRGRAYIYFGGPAMDHIADVYFEGQEGKDVLGSCVSGCGDVNKDGYDDVLIGASQWLTSKLIGKAYLVYGGNGMNLSNSKIFVGDSTKHDYGRAVAGLGDINNDGFLDFGIVGLEYIRIFSGKDFSLFFELNRSPARGGFVSISNCDDLNDDHIDDFIVSTERFAGQWTGGVLLFLGKSHIDSTPDLEFGGPQAPSYFGSTLSFYSNLDGSHNVLIGDDEGDGMYGSGKAYVYAFKTQDKIADQKSDKSMQFFLQQNYPNPFNSTTTITFQTAGPSPVTVRILNGKGELVKTLFSGRRESGLYSLIWDGTDESGRPVGSGVYFIQMVTDEENQNKNKNVTFRKAVLMR